MNELTKSEIKIFLYLCTQESGSNNYCGRFSKKAIAENANVSITHFEKSKPIESLIEKGFIKVEKKEYYIIRNKYSIPKVPKEVVDIALKQNSKAVIRTLIHLQLPKKYRKTATESQLAEAINCTRWDVVAKKVLQTAYALNEQAQSMHAEKTEAKEEKAIRYGGKPNIKIWDNPPKYQNRFSAAKIENQNWQKSFSFDLDLYEKMLNET